jgi:hypothetical protein
VRDALRGNEHQSIAHRVRSYNNKNGEQCPPFCVVFFKPRTCRRA